MMSTKWLSVRLEMLCRLRWCPAMPAAPCWPFDVFACPFTPVRRWLSVRLETLGTLCTLVAAVVAVEQRGSASASGLVLSYAMQITLLMSITLRVSSVTETMVGADWWHRASGGGFRMSIGK